MKLRRLAEETRRSVVNAYNWVFSKERSRSRKAVVAAPRHFYGSGVLADRGIMSLGTELQGAIRVPALERGCVSKSHHPKIMQAEAMKTKAMKELPVEGLQQHIQKGVLDIYIALLAEGSRKVKTRTTCKAKVSYEERRQGPELLGTSLY